MFTVERRREEKRAQSMSTVGVTCSSSLFPFLSHPHPLILTLLSSPSLPLTLSLFPQRSYSLTIPPHTLTSRPHALNAGLFLHSPTAGQGLSDDRGPRRLRQCPQRVRCVHATRKKAAAVRTWRELTLGAFLCLSVRAFVCITCLLVETPSSEPGSTCSACRRTHRHKRRPGAKAYRRQNDTPFDAAFQTPLPGTTRTGASCGR